MLMINSFKCELIDSHLSVCQSISGERIRRPPRTKSSETDFGLRASDFRSEAADRGLEKDGLRTSDCRSEGGQRGGV